VWFAGLGWTHLFDPTPATGITSGAGGSELPGELPVTLIPGLSTQTPETLPPANTTPSGTGAPTGTGASSGTGGTSPAGAGNSGSTPPTTRVAVPPSVSTTVESDNSVWTLVALVAVGIGVLVGAYVAAVMLLKQRRRRARRHDDDPALAVQGAWDEALDRLHEARLRADPALTPIELARATTTRTTPETGRPMRALARTYTTTRYGDRAPDPEDARKAWESVDELERALDEPLSTRERWRRRLDPSTLRVPAGSRSD
jgi:hypothetical protein